MKALSHLTPVETIHFHTEKINTFHKNHFFHEIYLDNHSLDR